MEIQLIPWSRELAPALCRIMNGADRRCLSTRLPLPYTQANADWYLGMVEECEGKSGVFRAVFSGGVCVGSISAECREDVYARNADVGYLLLDEFKSLGIMTRALERICPIAFRALDLLRLTGLVFEPNTASRRVLEKNGFLLEGQMKNAVWKDGSVYDLCIYGKYRDF